MAPAVVHGPSAIADLHRLDSLHCVDGRLGSLELLALLHHGARLRELRPELLGVRIGGRRRGRATAEKTIRGGRCNSRAAHHKRDPGAHGGDATLARATCPLDPRVVPTRGTTKGPLT